jgi:hypothetical protein
MQQCIIHSTSSQLGSNRDSAASAAQSSIVLQHKQKILVTNRCQRQAYLNVALLASPLPWQQWRHQLAAADMPAYLTIMHYAQLQPRICWFPLLLLQCAVLAMVCHPLPLVSQCGPAPSEWPARQQQQ